MVDHSVRYRVRYVGHVQGVGFRMTTLALARGLPLHGFVRNEPDGSVLGEWLCPEGAKAALEFGFQSLDEIVSLTSVQNLPSRRVMEKIGMTHRSSDDFDHPALPDGHELQRHVL